MCAFSTSLTTTVFSQRSMWRFETVPHRTIPEGQQSSIFHRALIPPSDCLPTARFLIRGALDGYCKKNGIRRSLGRTGICYDNAVSESTFATYKKELIHAR